VSLEGLEAVRPGLPQSWITLEQAVIHYAAGEVRWESGAHRGLSRRAQRADGRAVADRGQQHHRHPGVPRINPFALRPGLTNSKLFARDRNVAYCGEHFHEAS
jgi:hypothetical protein